MSIIVTEIKIIWLTNVDRSRVRGVKDQRGVRENIRADEQNLIVWFEYQILVVEGEKLTTGKTKRNASRRQLGQEA